MEPFFCGRLIEISERLLRNEDDQPYQRRQYFSTFSIIGTCNKAWLIS